jgi:hypothetical protein
MGSGSFATAINCMNGGTQIPVIDHVKRRFHVDYVDMATEPGRSEFLQSGKKTQRIDPSGRDSKSQRPSIVRKKTQLEQIACSIETVRSWEFKAEIIGLWVDEHWTAREIE